MRGATEAINLVASSWGDAHVGKGDEIVITEMEHHSNIVPWQLLAQRTGAVLKAAPLDDRGDVVLEAYEKLFTPRTRIAAVRACIQRAGAPSIRCGRWQISRTAAARLVLVDGAQAVPHLPVDVRAPGHGFLRAIGP